MVQLMLAEVSTKKLHRLPHSNNTIPRHIARMSSNSKKQVVEEMEDAPMFLFYLDESVVEVLCSQLLVFARNLFEKNTVGEIFLFCTSLSTATTADDGKSMVFSCIGFSN